MGYNLALLGQESGLDPWTCPMNNLEWDIEEEQMVQELLDTLVID